MYTYSTFKKFKGILTHPSCPIAFYSIQFISLYMHELLYSVFNTETLRGGCWTRASPTTPQPTPGPPTPGYSYPGTWSYHAGDLQILFKGTVSGQPILVKSVL